MKGEPGSSCPSCWRLEPACDVELSVVFCLCTFCVFMWYSVNLGWSTLTLSTVICWLYKNTQSTWVWPGHHRKHFESFAVTVVNITLSVPLPRLLHLKVSNIYKGLHRRWGLHSDIVLWVIYYFKWRYRGLKWLFPLNLWLVLFSLDSLLFTQCTFETVCSLHSQWKWRMRFKGKICKIPQPVFMFNFIYRMWRNDSSVTMSKMSMYGAAEIFSEVTMLTSGIHSLSHYGDTGL